MLHVIGSAACVPPATSLHSRLLTYSLKISGHGAPGDPILILARGLSLLSTVRRYPRDKAGLGNLISVFSTPGGFPRLVFSLRVFRI